MRRLARRIGAWVGGAVVLAAVGSGAAALLLTSLPDGCGRRSVPETRPAEQWRRDLDSPDPRVREAAAKALGQRSTSGDAP